MKTYNNLYQPICSFENIYKAYLKARRGKRYNVDALNFFQFREENLINIRNKLLTKTYVTGEYKYFTVCEPKERQIAALPFEDRIVQHALCNIIDPIFEKSFIYDSHACRIGFVILTGVQRTNYFLRNLAYNDITQKFDKQVYCLKCDIQKYFASIDHKILKKEIRRKIRCKDTLSLIDNIIDSTVFEVGIPIGNLTSQLFANIYLNKLDHYIKDVLQVKHYIRYMDDFIILSNDKEYLKMLLSKIKTFLDAELKLKLNRRTQIFLVGQRSVDYLGYKIWPEYRLLRKSNVKRTKRKFKKFQKLYKYNKISLETINNSMMSWFGHTKWADSYNLRVKVLDNLVFQRNCL